MSTSGDGGKVRARVEVRNLFPTPVVIAQVPDHARLNTALAKTILARAATGPSTAHSNLGGWQSDWYFERWGGAEGATILAFAQELATALTVDRLGKKVAPAWRLNAWANINRKGEANEFHTHPGSFWSGTYWVDDGGAAAAPALGGEFVIQDPRGVAPAMYRPEWVPRTEGGASMGAAESIRPVAGAMLLFPAWLSHAVRPYRGEGARISIAFNLI